MKTKLQFAKCLAGLLLLMSPGLYAQWDDGLWTGKQANNWYWSFNQGLTFESGSPQFAAGGQTTVMEGTAVMSSATGQLLFYASNGTVWNKNHMQMENGNDILSGSQSSTQSGIIIPKPGSETVYYLFNIALENGLVYSEIDMSLEGTLGAVTEKNVVLADDARTEKITAVYHADKERIWIISHRSGNNEFIAYLVSASGIAAPVTSAIGYSYTTDTPFEGPYVQEGPAGQLKASPNGSRLAAVQRQGELVGSGFVNGKIEVFDFDTTTGVVSDAVQITLANSAYGLEFSPDSHYLYALNDDYRPWVGALGTTFEKLYQYNLEAANIPASATLVGEYNSRYPSALQLGPDGKVYMMNSAGLNTMVAVGNPNNAGTAAGFQTNVVTLINSDSIGMPTFNQSYFESGILYEESCNNQVAFTLLRIPGVTGVAWNFGDPDSGAANTSDVAQHTFSAAGTYTITAQITSNGAVQTAQVEVEVTGGVALTQPQNLQQCTSGSTTAVFDLTVQEPIILAGLNAEDYTVGYYPSELDAQNGTNAFTNPESFSSAGQVIYVGIVNTQNGCTATTAFGLVVSPPAQLPVLPQLSQCNTQNNNTAVFDLTQQNTLLLQSQPGAAIAYYTTAQDAAAGTNAISAPAEYTNTANPQTLFVSVSNGACSATTQFTVQVLPAPALPQLPQLPQLSACAVNPANNEAVFNLTQQQALLPQDIAISYFTSEEDVAANANALANPESFTNTQNPQTIYVSAGSGSCFSITSFVVSVIAAPSPDAEPLLTGCPPFNLSAAIGEGQTGLQFSYYPSEDDAVAQTSAIANPQSFDFEGEQAVVYIRAENELGCTAILPLGLLAEGCIIPRGVSPDGDTKNDTFDLTSFNVDRLSIFNRYGQEVYTRDNYTNQWYGQTDNNRELPSGTYYYFIRTKEGTSKTGWVYVNRSTN